MFDEESIKDKLETYPEQTYQATNGVKLFVSYHNDDPVVMFFKGNDEWIDLDRLTVAIEELMQ